MAYSERERPFGIGLFRPRCLQVLANIQGFVIIMAAYSVFAGMFSTYSISQITTIEKHFGMTSERSGFLFTVQDIGFFVLSPFMGIFFCRLHRPRVLAVCCFGQALSNLFFVLPFIIHMSEINLGETVVATYQNETSSELCEWSYELINKTCQDAAEGGGSESWAYWLMAVGMFINGAGATGLWTLGIAYIDDNAGPLDSPKYLGSLFCLRFLAPIMGSLLGSGVGRVHVHLEASGSSATWVGAWWLGYTIIGGATFTCVLPLMMFPRKLPEAIKRDQMMEMSEKGDAQPSDVHLTSDDHANDHIADNSNDQVADNSNDHTADQNATQNADHHAHHATSAHRNSRSERHKLEAKRKQSSEICDNEMENFDAKDLYRALIRIATNVPFVLLCLGLTVDIAGGVAYASFLPKYLEDQFYVTPSVSNLIMGVCVPLADAAGMAFSGWFMSNTKMRLSRLFMIAVCLEICIYLFTLTLMAPTCPTVEMKGINTGAMLEECNMMCQCELGAYSPVCGSDHLTYYSPCFAGCTEYINNNDTYHSCGCLPLNSTQSAVPGLCTDQCDASLLIYAAILFLVNMLGSTMTMVFMMFILRVVERRDKSLGQSTINVSAAIGSMPAATLFGRLIDSFCLLSYPSTGCDSESGACLRYDRDQFRYKFHGAAYALRIAGCLTYFVVWYGIRNRKFAGDEERKNREKKGCCDLKGAVED